MTLQASGVITLDDIATEFGGTAPHSLSEYYGVDTGVPASGAIALSDFYGTSDVTTTLHTITMGSSTCVWGYDKYGISGGTMTNTVVNGVTIIGVAALENHWITLLGNIAAFPFTRVKFSAPAYTGWLTAANFTRVYHAAANGWPNRTEFGWANTNTAYAWVPVTTETLTTEF